MLDRFSVLSFFIPLDTWWSLFRFFFDPTIDVGSIEASMIYLFVPFFADWFGYIGFTLTDDGKIPMG